MNCLPDLASKRSKNCTFDSCWHFSITMNYMLKISAGKVFRSNLRNVFQLSEKKTVNYNFQFFIYLSGNLYRKFAGKFRSIIFVIDLQWKAKQGFVPSHRAPTFQPSSSYRACNLLPTFPCIRCKYCCVFRVTPKRRPCRLQTADRADHADCADHADWVIFSNTWLIFSVL